MPTPIDDEGDTGAGGSTTMVVPPGDDDNDDPPMPSAVSTSAATENGSSSSSTTGTDGGSSESSSGGADNTCTGEPVPVLQWTVEPPAAEATALALADDGTIYVGGVADSDAWIGAYSGDGETLWEVTLAGDAFGLEDFHEEVVAIEVSDAGDLFVLADAPDGVSDEDVLVFRFDPVARTVLWSILLPEPPGVPPMGEPLHYAPRRPGALAVAPNGELIVTSLASVPNQLEATSLLSAIDPDTGEELWRAMNGTNVIEAGPVAVAESGDIYHAPLHAGGGAFGSRLLWSSSNGVLLDESSVPGSDFGVGVVVSALVVDDTGSLQVTGTTNQGPVPTADLVAARVSADFGLVESLAIFDEWGDQQRALSATINDDQRFVVGYVETDDEEDAVLIALDWDGDFHWRETDEVAGPSRWEAVVYDPDDALVILGDGEDGTPELLRFQCLEQIPIS